MHAPSSHHMRLWRAAGALVVATLLLSACNRNVEMAQFHGTSFDVDYPKGHTVAVVDSNTVRFDKLTHGQRASSGMAIEVRTDASSRWATKPLGFDHGAGSGGSAFTLTERHDEWEMTIELHCAENACPRQSQAEKTLQDLAYQIRPSFRRKP